MRETIQDLDKKIRDGDFGEVRIRLESLNLRSIDRQYWADLGNIARRVGMFLWALRLLRPVVHNENKLVTASAKEKIIYAANLIKIGSFSEAIQLLTPESSSNNEAKLYLAFSYFPRWEYKKAVPLLEAYISGEEDPYKKTVGEINLVAAYIQCGFLGKARERLAKILMLAQKEQWTLLYGNSLELSAQLYIAKKDWDNADRHLRSLSAFTKKNDQSRYALFYKKWQTIAKVSKETCPVIISKGIGELRKFTKEIGHEETLRECDYYEAILTKNQNLFNKLYFGTPYSSYTQKLKNAVDPVAIPNQYIWKIHDGNFPVTFDLFEGTASGKEILVPGSLCHRLLTFLTIDFYRSFMIGEIYAYLYPGEYFNPNSSPGRIAKVIQRTRQHLNDKNIPLQISAVNQQYILGAKTPVHLLVQKQRDRQWKDRQQEQVQTRLEILKEKWPYQSFSSSEAAKVLSLSKRSTQNLLSEALKENSISAQGQARALRYYFKKAG